MRDNFPCDQDLDDRNIWPVERRFTRADQAGIPPGVCITSVFDLAFTPLTLRGPFASGTRCPHYRIERGDGVTRYRQVEEQQTEAWIKREENRRARQVLPRPTRAAGAYWSQFAGGQPDKPSPEPKPKPPKPERKPRITPEKLDQAIGLVQGGMPLRKAGEAVGIYRMTIAKHMRQRGIPTPPSTRERRGAAA